MTVLKVKSLDKFEVIRQDLEKMMSREIWHG